MLTTIEVLVTPALGAVGRDPADPFRYGWRYVSRRRADGTEEIEQIPLTLEDVLHPWEGDQVTHAEAHERRCTYLYDVLTTRLAVDRTAVVLKDVRVAWDIPDMKPHGPDLAVILGVRERKNWSTFDVTAEGVRPALIIEITSPETASVDRSQKLEEYDLVGVPLYVIVDTLFLRRQPTLRLLGYQQTPTGYQPLGANERGWLWLAPARTWLGIQDDEIVCYDEAGRPLGNYRELAAALSEAARELDAVTRDRDEALTARAEAEQRVEAAESRLRELEAEVRRLRGEQG